MPSFYGVFMRTLLITIILSILASPVLASKIRVDKMNIDFTDTNQHAESIHVYNGSTETAYVAIDLIEVIDAGLSTEHRVLYRQLRGGDATVKIDESTGYELRDIKGSQLVITPSKMIITAQSGRAAYGTVKIIRVGKMEAVERIYRLRVRPVIDGFQMSEGQNIGLKLLVGYELLVTVHPNEKIVSQVLEKNKQGYLLKNTGNVNFYIEKAQHCIAKICTKLNAKRVYAGDNYNLPLTVSEGVFKYNRRVGVKSTPMEIALK
jgi:hypothetical protein